jgi:hypothetical protein
MRWAIYEQNDDTAFVKQSLSREDNGLATLVLISRACISASHFQNCQPPSLLRITTLPRPTQAPSSFTAVVHSGTSTVDRKETRTQPFYFAPINTEHLSEEVGGVNCKPPQAGVEEAGGSSFCISLLLVTINLWCPPATLYKVQTEINIV